MKLNRIDNLKKGGYTAREILIRLEIPYGKWTLNDGTEILFNREYKNLIGKKNGKLIAYHYDNWHENIIKSEFYYDDGVAVLKSTKTLLELMKIKYDFIQSSERKKNKGCDCIALYGEHDCDCE